MVRSGSLLVVSGTCFAMAAVLASLIVYDLIPGRNWMRELQEQGQVFQEQSHKLVRPSKPKGRR